MTLSTFAARYKSAFVPALILLISIVMSGYLVHTKVAEGAVTYSWEVTTDCVDGSFGCTNFATGYFGSCDAAHVGFFSQRRVCSNRAGCEVEYTNTLCVAHGAPDDPTCGGNRANTCTTATCSDGAGNVYQGTMDCSVPCYPLNACGAYNVGTMVGGVCSASAPPTVDACPLNPGLQCNFSECTAPPPPPTTCTPSYCGSASSMCSGDSCTITASDCSTATVYGTNTTGSCAVPPPPPNCAANGCTAASTCSGSSCVNSCGVTVNGTNTTGSCSVPPPSGPGSCTNPTVSITAGPTRVNSGATTVLTVTGSGLNQSCTVTGTGSGSSMSQTLTPTSCNLNPNPTSITTPPITTQSTFTVTCLDGPVGSTFVAATASTIVNINPTFKPF